MSEFDFDSLISPIPRAEFFCWLQHLPRHGHRDLARGHAEPPRENMTTALARSARSIWIEDCDAPDGIQAVSLRYTSSSIVIRSTSG